jgi:L-fucose isomerase-like protein
VTASTRVPSGETVTLARAQRNLERISACAGELLGCGNTEFCRNTLSINLPDVRRFAQKAGGNHHAMVFRDCLENLKALCSLLDCEFQQL